MTTWQSAALCVGQDQADHVVPPGNKEAWKPSDAAVIVAAIRRCQACPVRADCFADALEDRRDGVSGGIYQYHSGRNVRRWNLLGGKLRKLSQNRVSPR